MQLPSDPIGSDFIWRVYDFPYNAPQADTGTSLDPACYYGCYPHFTRLGYPRKEERCLCLLFCLLLGTAGRSIALSATVAKGRLGIYMPGTCWTRLKLISHVVTKAIRVPTLMFEIVIFLTAAFQGTRELRNYRILSRAHRNFGPEPIMALILKDSVFYFVMCILLNSMTDKILATHLQCPWLRAYRVISVRSHLCLNIHTDDLE